MKPPCRAKESGQALTEFVMVFLMFMMTLLFAMQMSLISNSNALLSVASYNAARKFAITQDTATALRAAKLYLSKIAEKDSVKVTAVGDGVSEDGKVDQKKFSFGKPFKLRTSFEYGLLQVPLVTELFKSRKAGAVSQRLVTWKGENPPASTDIGLKDDETMTLISSEAKATKTIYTIVFDEDIYERTKGIGDAVIIGNHRADMSGRRKIEVVLDKDTEPTVENLFKKFRTDKKPSWQEPWRKDGDRWGYYYFAGAPWVVNLQVYVKEVSRTSRDIEWKRGEWIVLVTKEKHGELEKGKLYLSRWVAMTSE